MPKIKYSTEWGYAPIFQAAIIHGGFFKALSDLARQKIQLIGIGEANPGSLLLFQNRCKDIATLTIQFYQ